MMHSFLLIGQSNMAGRGLIGEVNSIYSETIKVLMMGKWATMMSPINYDGYTSGISLAESFAEAYGREHDVYVGLIPCANGGTYIKEWEEGGMLYDHAIYQCRLALRASNIAGVLWHHGEQDCTSDGITPFYEESLIKMINAFRRDLNLYDVPFIIGGLGDFLPDSGIEGLKYYSDMNALLKGVADKLPMTGFVPADGLTANSDNIHFNAKSLRMFGHRYYDVFKTLENKNKIFEEKAPIDHAMRSVNEKI